MEDLIELKNFIKVASKICLGFIKLEINHYNLILGYLIILKMKEVLRLSKTS